MKCPFVAVQQLRARSLAVPHEQVRHETVTHERTPKTSVRELRPPMILRMTRAKVKAVFRLCCAG